MDTKDWLLVVAVVLLVGGPIGLHLHKRGKGQLKKGPQATDSIIDDNRRLGTAVASYGGKTISEGSKLLKSGSLRFQNREENKKMQLVGGA